MGKDKDKKKKKHHKSSKRSRSPSPRRHSSSSAHDDGLREIRRLQKEEKRRRREQVSEICGYTDEDNRFGDPNLTQKFVWGKKNEKYGESASMSGKQRKAEVEAEVLKVKKRRDEMEAEKAFQEEERDRIERERRIASMGNWEQEEEEFHRNQAKKRSEIRLREGRAKPIDIIAKNINFENSKSTDVEFTEPYKLFRGLTLGELEELKVDIAAHTELADKKKYGKFWNAMSVVCEDELSTARRNSDLSKLTPSERRGLESGIPESVKAEAESMFQGKRSDELEELESQIQGNIKQGGAVDTEFFEQILSRLQVAKAKATLREQHRELLTRRLAAMEAMGLEESMRADEGGAADGAGGGGDGGAGDDLTNALAKQGNNPNITSAAMMEEMMSEPTVIEAVWEEEEEDGRYTPPLNPKAGEGEVVIDARQDFVELLEARAAVLAKEAAKNREAMLAAQAAASEEDEMYQNEAQKTMADGEIQFGGGAEVSTSGKVYWWHDKYRPRKPRYFNRVHTGYDWNKYNQTHYDHDNPPPKIVQGYKFNLFYPDLIDKTKAPTYTILPDADPETVILRFSAGPPYEDVAFRIVNKEWEYSHKHGFKCTFDRGILHLYINFKRYRYRR